MRQLPTKVLVLGSAALKIGEAGEFDYSGSQAIKVLKEENIETVLVNPNIATVQTSDNLADHVYFLPVTVSFVEKVIEKERPDGILLSFGGQTALNCGLQLHRLGILDQYGVRILGTPVETIQDTEDRDAFVRKLDQIQVKTPRSLAVTTVPDAVDAARQIGFPVMARVGFALGGLGSGVCHDERQLQELAQKAFAHTQQILIEEYLEGWKEVEYEVVRDGFDNCITVCNMENLDPLGIHTGESIVVAPSQTLTNTEYHLLREISIRTIRHLGVIGECNIQFALDPRSQDYRVIEVNARLSRSSALASKATGYPLAVVAAKLSLGYALTEIRNAVTQVTSACFEPSLDYVVVKMPRWDLKKFRHVDRQIGTAMKSVGEVMAIGRTFPEALQKVIRMLEIGLDGLSSSPTISCQRQLSEELENPTDRRIYALYEALRQGKSVDWIYQRTRIDHWFVHQVDEIRAVEQELRRYAHGMLPQPLLKQAKQMGFSDRQIAAILDCPVSEVTDLRSTYDLHPAVKQIDTTAAEFPAKTNYLYLTYHGVEDDVQPDDRPTIMILGSGAYRIGSSVEFDWCCVNTAQTLRQQGYNTVMVNYNPETVSTDFDECDRLYFDEISLESVREIYVKENCRGVIVSMGGQVPNNLAIQLHKCGLNVLGTSANSIDDAENRHKFSSILDRLGISQPQWIEASSVEDSEMFANQVGYPVLVRPSYVLSGAAMAVASNDRELEDFLQAATEISPEHPVVVSKFIADAKEIEIDGVAQQGEIVAFAISEHIENAGVHSGDATMVLPPQRTYLETIRKIKKITSKICHAFKIHGPFNVQFVAKNNDVQVIELNLRASRSFPFVSKVCGVNLVDLATRVMIGEPLPSFDKSFMELDYVGVKAPQFSFTRLAGADPTTGVEMASTGEVGCLGDDFDEAFLKAMLSVGYRLPVKHVLVSSGPIESKADLLPDIRQWVQQGVSFYATAGTAEFLERHGVPATVVAWPLDDNGKLSAVDVIRDKRVELVINIPKNFQEQELTNDYMIRRAAVDYNVPLITNLQLAMRFFEAVTRHPDDQLHIKSWGEYQKH